MKNRLAVSLIACAVLAWAGCSGSDDVDSSPSASETGSVSTGDMEGAVLVSISVPNMT